MKNRVMDFPDSQAVAWTNSTGSAVAAGAVVALANRYAVANVDIANGSAGTLYTRGRFKVAKATGFTTTVGQKLWWDAANARISTTPVGETAIERIPLGECAKAAASGDTTVEVNINELTDNTGLIHGTQLADATDASNGYITLITGLSAAPSGVVMVQARNPSSTFQNRVVANVELLSGGDAGKIKATITSIANGDKVSFIVSPNA